MKLESFAGTYVVRPCPAADSHTPHSEEWKSLRPRISYSKISGLWDRSDQSLDDWNLQHRGILFGLKPTPFGHLGVFCEQVDNWDWILDRRQKLAHLNAINLFAYTGGTTLALAQAGASVVHLDSAKNVVNWARENAKRSEMSHHPIRWIVDDALKFVDREIRRGNRYDIIIADPPAVGHAGNKMTWKIDRDLPLLFSKLGLLASDSLMAVIFSCHSFGFDHKDLKRLANSEFKFTNGSQQAGEMRLHCQDGRSLNCGHFFRWCAN